jgi:hypothetical protein
MLLCDDFRRDETNGEDGMSDAFFAVLMVDSGGWEGVKGDDSRPSPHHHPGNEGQKHMPRVKKRRRRRGYR